MTNDGLSYTVALTREGGLVVNGSTLAPPSFGEHATPDDHLEWALKEIAGQHDQNNETLFLTIEDHRQGGYGLSEVELAPGEYATIEDLRNATGRDLSGWSGDQHSNEGGSTSSSVSDEADPGWASFAADAEGGESDEDSGASVDTDDGWADDGQASKERGVGDEAVPEDEGGDSQPTWWDEVSGERDETQGGPSWESQEPVIFGQHEIDRGDGKSRGWKSAVAKAVGPKPKPDKKPKRKRTKGAVTKKGVTAPQSDARTAAAAARDAWTPYKPAQGTEPPGLDEQNEGEGKARRPRRPIARARTRTLVAVAVVAALCGAGITKVLAERGQATKYVAVCVDQRTQARAETIDPCKEDAEEGHYRWWYVAEGGKVPAVGGAVNAQSGSFVKPEDDAPVTYDYAQAGGVIEKE